MMTHLRDDVELEAFVVYDDGELSPLLPLPKVVQVNSKGSQDRNSDLLGAEGETPAVVKRVQGLKI